MNSELNCCPKCKSPNIRFREKRGNWICDDCDYVFTVPDNPDIKPEKELESQSPGRIFISYGHDCTPIVNRIMQDLTRLGYDVWVDNNEIKSGDDWRNSITNGILDSQVVLYFLSKFVCLRKTCGTMVTEGIMEEQGGKKYETLQKVKDMMLKQAHGY